MCVGGKLPSYTAYVATVSGHARKKQCWDASRIPRKVKALWLAVSWLSTSKQTKRFPLTTLPSPLNFQKHLGWTKPQLHGKRA